ncbi:hypothetical protein DFH07DRAFT_768765 [Mycena maculata]|uniref:Uncharacterized protein n=1 Tax=Mycena maculata TaxID=230809 RepID=A0AAD7JTL3_9AGAR|nr:hypothetical protein DFH07DRAFT_768765 [Mycena maculata]
MFGRVRRSVTAVVVVVRKAGCGNPHVGEGLGAGTEARAAPAPVPGGEPPETASGEGRMRRTATRIPGRASVRWEEPGVGGEARTRALADEALAGWEGQSVGAEARRGRAARERATLAGRLFFFGGGARRPEGRSAGRGGEVAHGNPDAGEGVGKVVLGGTRVPPRSRWRVPAPAGAQTDSSGATGGT